MSQTSDLAFALISALEGLRLNAYQDQGGVWTIGYGHTRDVKEGDTCSLAQARIWFDDDCSNLLNLVNAGSFSIVQQAAYISFGYNCGKVALEHVLSGKAKISEFCHIGNRVSDDLVRRRALEQSLIDSSKGK